MPQARSDDSRERVIFMNWKCFTRRRCSSSMHTAVGFHEEITALLAEVAAHRAGALPPLCDEVGEEGGGGLGVVATLWLGSRQCAL